MGSESIYTFDDVEVADLRTAVQMRKRRVVELMSELAIVGEPDLVQVLGDRLSRLERLDARLATREVGRG